MKMDHENPAAFDNDNETNPMDKLLAKLSEQKDAIAQQQKALKSSEDMSYSRTVEYITALSNSIPITPASESLRASTAPTTNAPSVSGDDKPDTSVEELLYLKLELEAAKAKMARMDQELAQTRITKHTLDQVIGTPSELDFSSGRQDEVHRANSFERTLNVRPQIQRDNSWAGHEDSRSDTSDALSAGGFNRSRAIWGNGAKPVFPTNQGPMANYQPAETLAAGQFMGRGFGQPFVDGSLQYSSPPMNSLRGGDRMMPEPDLLMGPPGNRRNIVGGRFNNRAVGSFPYSGSNSSYDGFTPVSTPYGSVAGMGNPMGMGMSGISSGMPISGGLSGGMYGGYQPQPIGTPLSPHAPEFNANGSGWKTDVSI
jgi:hypothetical protein